ncbi:hypothetical protein [Sorangium sp. So ce1153]|uniref:hypothetical protein n=1 Tax=Sorangium sp. So ce1153 TaxID=3133333 RepID=UPI003F63597C
MKTMISRPPIKPFSTFRSSSKALVSSVPALIGRANLPYWSSTTYYKHHTPPSYLGRNAADLLAFAKEKHAERNQKQPIRANTVVEPLGSEAKETVLKAIDEILYNASKHGYSKLYVRYNRGTHYKQAITTHTNGNTTAEHIIYLLFERNSQTGHYEAVHYETPNGIKEGTAIFQAGAGSPTINLPAKNK